MSEVIALLGSSDRPLKDAEIALALKLNHKLELQLRNILAILVQEKRILRKKKSYALASDSSLLKATLDLTSRGFGFGMVVGEDQKGKDIFLAPNNLGGASHGDTILVQVTGTSRGRREGKVIKVVERSITRLCGRYTAGGKTGFVSPDNEKLPYTVLIKKSNSLAAGPGAAVVVEITDYGTGERGPEGKIVEILGDPTSPKVQIQMAIIQFKLHTTFPTEVLEEVEQLEPIVKCEAGREDLRHINHVTIDGATAKDFDDAIAVEHDSNGFTLYVSIADVAHYVKTGSEVDREAYQRGTSVYLPDRVLPMLPERLSNDLCSLVPNQDRPAFTAILSFNGKGKRVGERYTKSMICSKQRFTYSTVNQLLYLDDQTLRSQHQDLVPMLEQAKRLSTVLNKRRLQRGSLGFNLPEAQIHLLDDQVESIILSERNQAHMLIEEFMLAANEAVAETLAKAKTEVLFRIHEDPDKEKLENFIEVAKILDLQLPKAEVSPAWFARVLREAENSPSQYVVNTLLLRTMQQARYAPANTGHFGLAADFYLHFTSPIRRYPDLVAHRALHAFLCHKSAVKKPTVGSLPRETTFADAGVFLSKCERTAISTERNVRSRLAALFLHDKIGEEFEAIISGVTSFGLFVELLNYYISGGIPLKSMDDDFYLHDQKRHCLIGERSNRFYRLGDVVRVRLDYVDLNSKKITFSLAGDVDESPVK